ncbi:MAG: hypothetical protein DHS80DRAFT_25787 [Piptocephalis tieghemiana]|nr:MAG: hypothetical protein DHS80DRAFT_25787 [Piptocephalis tieghemiana]
MPIFGKKYVEMTEEDRKHDYLMKDWKVVLRLLLDILSEDLLDVKRELEKQSITSKLRRGSAGLLDLVQEKNNDALKYDEIIFDHTAKVLLHLVPTLDALYKYGESSRPLVRWKRPASTSHVDSTSFDKRIDKETYQDAKAFVSAVNLVGSMGPRRAPFILLLRATTALHIARITRTTFRLTARCMKEGPKRKLDLRTAQEHIKTLESLHILRLPDDLLKSPDDRAEDRLRRYLTAIITHLEHSDAPCPKSALDGLKPYYMELLKLFQLQKKGFIDSAIEHSNRLKDLSI